LQRLREPENAAKELQSAEWLGLFRGRDSRSEWQMAAALPPEAQFSGKAIVEGVRSELIMLAAAEQQAPQLPHH
jgi:hypothetical protein